MANPGYVRSTDGDDADDGSTWALANATLVGAMTDQVAGDRIWISQAHAETQASAMTITAPGTIANPNQILFGNDSAEPPTSLTTSGSITTTSTNSITIRGSFYWYGGVISAGTGTGAGSITLADQDNNHQVFENTAFTLGATGTSGRIIIGATGSTTEMSVVLINPTIKFTGSGTGVGWIGSRLRVFGGSIDGSSAAITALQTTATGGRCDTVVDGFDLSAAASTVNLLPSGIAAVGRFIFRDCVLPPNWSGLLLVGDPANAAFRAEMWNCASAVGGGHNNFSMRVSDLAGIAREETTIRRTGGASDGDTPVSWKLDTKTSAIFPYVIFRSAEIAVPLSTTGAKTLTVEFVRDDNVAAGQGAGASNNFRDDEWWLQAHLLATTDSPKATITTGRPTVIGTPTAHASSSVAWTTTGLTTPVKQKMTLSVTNNEKCTLIVTICGAKASKTIYACPKVDVT